MNPKRLNFKKVFAKINNLVLMGKYSIVKDSFIGSDEVLVIECMFACI